MGFEFRGTTLLLSAPEFAARVGGQTGEMGEYLRTVRGRLAEYYGTHPDLSGGRDLIITVAPGARQRSWLVARAGLVDEQEAACIHDLLDQIPPPTRVYKPILFALTYTTGTVPSASMSALRLPTEFQAIARETGKDGIDTEELVERLWGDTDEA
jgi:hypothetical protein